MAPPGAGCPLDRPSRGVSASLAKHIERRPPVAPVVFPKPRHHLPFFPTAPSRVARRPPHETRSVRTSTCGPEDA